MRVSDSSFVPVGNSSKIPQKRHSDDDISFKLPKKSKVHNARHGLFHKAGDQASLPAKEFASNRYGLNLVRNLQAEFPQI